jgi:hypothetical protein
MGCNMFLDIAIAGGTHEQPITRKVPDGLVLLEPSGLSKMRSGKWVHCYRCHRGDSSKCDVIVTVGSGQLHDYD